MGAYLSSFSFGAFPNRLDQQLMVEIASLLLMAVKTDAPMQNKRGVEKQSLTEQQKCVTISSISVMLYQPPPFPPIVL